MYSKLKTPAILTSFFLKIIILSLSMVAPFLTGCGADNFATVSIGDDLLVLNNPRISIRDLGALELVLFSTKEDDHLTLFAFKMPKEKDLSMAIGPDEKVSGTFVRGPLIETLRSDGVWIENTFAKTSVLASGQINIEEADKGRSRLSFSTKICPKKSDCHAPMFADGTFLF